MKRSILLTSALLLNFYTLHTVAETPLFQSPPDEDLLADILFPPIKVDSTNTDQLTSLKRSMRGIGGVRKGHNENTKDTDYLTTVKKAKRTFSLGINFDSNSYNPTQQSLPLINKLGKMLTLQKMRDKKILIEGHTDAIGSADANKKLSLRRALSIKTYLVAQYSINPERLMVTGRGESQPLIPDHPNASENRRVQILPFEKF